MPLAPRFLSVRCQGISYPFDSFSGNQRMINIYDGPSHQERNAFLDIPVSTSASSKMRTNQWPTAALQRIRVSLRQPGRVRFAVLMSAPVLLLTQCRDCLETVNGFYYPPAFHSDKLYFQNVDIRHFVIEPLFDYGTFNNRSDPNQEPLLHMVNMLFNNFTDIDRQTVLNDDDGSLTGLLADLGGGDTRETISVNRPYQQRNGFFNDPKVTVQCASDWHGTIRPPGTADTSPMSTSPPLLSLIAVSTGADASKGALALQIITVSWAPGRRPSIVLGEINAAPAPAHGLLRSAAVSPISHQPGVHPVPTESSRIPAPHDSHDGTRTGAAQHSHSKSREVLH